MAWLIIRVCDDRQGKHTVDVLRKRSKLCDPKTSDVARLAEKHGIEVRVSFQPPPRKEWPWSIAPLQFLQAVHAYRCSSNSSAKRRPSFVA